MKIAVIPARGGSKRIPRKNIREFAGKPIIVHAINAAQRSGLFEHVIVSTDDEEIAAIAIAHGAEVPFMRPVELADAYTPTVPVIAHAVQASQRMEWLVTHACCIYPCVPFIDADDIKGAFSLLESSIAAYSFPVTVFPSAIQRALQRFPDGRMRPFYPEFELTRTQDLEVAYHDAGQFYWGKSASWLTNNQIHSSSVGYPIPSWRVFDIDTPEDWERAEMLYKAFSKQGS